MKLALTGGLTGEYERLKSLGYVVKQDEVNERAYEIALRNTTVEGERWNFNQGITLTD